MRPRSFISRIMAVLGLALALAGSGHLAGPPAVAQSGSRTFPETGHTVRGRFLQYWETHGGLAQQGYPISEEFTEVSATNGMTYTVQYFERAVFEYHPENAGTPYEVLLSLLGVPEYALRYGTAGAPNQHASTDNPRAFPETGHTLGGAFRAYWESHGGLAQQGYPVSDEFQEQSALDGKTYTVQYFQRAVFELHPENAGTPFEVLLSQLGTFNYRDKYQPPRQALPGRPGYRQFGPAASPEYLVWTEASDPRRDNTADIFARDLHTGQVITVTDAPGDQYDNAISGSLVVWDSGLCCGERDVLGKDLATGRSFEVATGPADQVQPAIAGHSVAWIEADATGEQLRLLDLDSKTTTTVMTLPGGSTTFGRPALSDEYLVWAEQPPYDSTHAPATPIRALNRRTGAIRLVATAQAVSLGHPYPEYALSDHRLVWGTGALQITDLTNGDAHLLWAGLANSPAIAGDTVVWSASSGDMLAIWGLRLSEGTPRILVAGRGNKSGPTLAGDLLAWTNEGGPFDGRITTASLAAAFAGSSLPPTPPTPGPPGPSPTPLAPAPLFTETPAPATPTVGVGAP